MAGFGDSMPLTNMFRTDGWVKTSQGPAVPGAQIFVCLQPANIASLPPTPLANIFSDVNGLVPITQPIISDGFGHYNFYAAAGVYTVIIGLAGIVQQVYPDQSIGGASGTQGGGTALVLQVNGVPASSQLLQNLIGVGGVTVVDQGNGTIAINTPAALTLRTNGVPNAVQNLLNLTGAGGVALADQGNGTVSITVPPSGLVLGSVQWVPAFQTSTVSWIATGDTTSGADSGATPTYILPTASANAVFTLSGTRHYIGNTMIYGGRPATFSTVATFTRGTDTFSVAALGLFHDLGWAAGAPFTITTTPCAAFHIPAAATTWFAVTGDGASVTDVDTGVSFTSRHVLKIAYTPTAVVFTIDGAIVATNTTTLPTTSSLAMTEVNNRGLGASVPVLSVEYLNCNFATV